MRYPILRLGTVGVFVASAVLLLNSCTDHSCPTQPESEYSFDYARGIARLWAPYNMVFLPGTLSGLYFDTAYSYKTIHTAPKWQFIGRLKVDSLVRDGKIERVTSAGQLDGVIIEPAELRDCLAEHGIYHLGRRMPRAVPYDTLYWDDVRQRWWILPDLSMHFHIRFDDSRSVKQTLSCLDQVGGLANLGPISVPVPD